MVTHSDSGRRSSLGGALKSVGKYLKEQSAATSETGVSLQPPPRRPSVHHIPHQFSLWDPAADLKNQDAEAKKVVQDLAHLCPSEELSLQRHELEQRQRFAGAGGDRMHDHAPEPYEPKSLYLSMTNHGSIGGKGCFRNMTRQRYATDHVLNTMDILVPERDLKPAEDESQRYWVVYIHGGYFRDPKINSASMLPAVSLIEESSLDSCPSLSPYSSKAGSRRNSSQSEIPPQVNAALRDRISGYASINYRLASHPGHPQCPETTSASMLNDASWPDQPDDIVRALKYLQAEHPASRKHVLIGHSVGATLAFMTAIQASQHGIVPPKALISCAGIFDFPLLHETNPEYENLTRNAIDRSDYAKASPARHVNADWAFKTMAETNTSKQQIILAHSDDDELVGTEQAARMRDVLAMSQPPAFDVTMVKLSGGHNEAWSEGVGLVRAVQACFESMDRATKIHSN